MEELRLQAPAKINLHLQVLNKRQDGFHNISSLFTLIDLCDTLSFKKNKTDIELTESVPFENNIVLKAANLIKEYCSVEEGVRIELNKNIPDQKGLGGGSSDAASTLIGLKKFWGLDISKKELLDLAIQLGSDVPFFVFGKTAWAEGRGEILKEFDYKDRFFLLALPEIKISTKYAFNELSKLKAVTPNRPRPKAVEYYNSFEGWLRKTKPEADNIFKELESVGVPRLSGTGSAIFMEYENLNEAKLAKKHFPELVLTKSLERSPLMQIIE